MAASRRSKKSSRQKKNARKTEGGEIPQSSTGSRSLAGKLSKAQVQRLRAEAARERWIRSQAAKKGAETRRRKALAAIERQVAAGELQQEVAKATADLIAQEAQVIVDRAKAVVNEPAVTLSEKKRQGAALSEAEREIQRLREERLHPSEVIAITKKAQINVQLGRELVEQAILDFYEKAKEEGRIERISRHHKPGTIAKVDYRERFGVVADRKSGKLLTEGNLEEILHQMLQAARAVGRRQPGGKLYATFSYFEYGKDKPRSGYSIQENKSGDPSAGIVKDEFGYFYQSFDATNYLGGAENEAALEIKLRAVLERKLKESGGRNAVVIAGFQLKSYIDRNEEERHEYDRQKWRKLKRAQRKAELLKQKTGESTWINVEDVDKEK